MPLPTAYVLALMPSNVSTPFGMSGNPAGLVLWTSSNRLIAMTKVKISNWKRDMLAMPLASLSRADRLIFPVQIQTIMVRPSAPTNRQSTNPNTCPIKPMTILLLLLAKVVKRPRFSGGVDSAASTHQVEPLRTHIWHRAAGIGGYLGEIGCTRCDRCQQQLKSLRTDLVSPVLVRDQAIQVDPARRDLEENNRGKRVKKPE